MQFFSKISLISALRTATAYSFSRQTSEFRTQTIIEVVFAICVCAMTNVARGSVSPKLSPNQRGRSRHQF